MEEDFFAADRDQKLLSEAHSATASAADQAYQDYYQQTRMLEQIKSSSIERLGDLERRLAELMCESFLCIGDSTRFLLL